MCSTLSFLFLVLPFRPLSALHSFPTRRSSDLPPNSGRVTNELIAARQLAWTHELEEHLRPIAGVTNVATAATLPFGSRSEEHTSELQSLRHLVCRLLLETKNKGDAHRDC